MTLKEKEIYLRKFLEQHKEAFNEKSRLSTWEDNTNIFLHFKLEDKDIAKKDTPAIARCTFFTQDILTGCAVFQCLTNKYLPNILNEIQKEYRNDIIMGFTINIELYHDTKELRSATIALTLNHNHMLVDDCIYDMQCLTDLFVQRTKEILYPKQPQPGQTGQYVILSTMHLDEKLLQDMKENGETDKLGISVYRYEYGFCIPIPAHVSMKDCLQHTDWRLHPFLRYAYQHNFQLLIFDEELAEPCPDFPVYD